MNLRIAGALLFGLGGTAILVGLGLWQMQRLDWKEGVIAGIAARLEEAPEPLPEAVNEADDEYRRVSLTGRLIAEQEIAVLVTMKPEGPGFRIISPFETPDGRRILVDRGYVPERLKDRAARPSEPDMGYAVASGALLWPDETDSFTPPPDEGAGIWFARDLPAMAAALGTEPVLVVLSTPMTGDWPRPVPVTVNLPNDHLEYALTWFSLAAIWLAMTVVLVRRERRRPAS